MPTLFGTIDHWIGELGLWENDLGKDVEIVESQVGLNSIVTVDGKERADKQHRLLFTTVSDDGPDRIQSTKVSVLDTALLMPVDQMC